MKFKYVVSSLSPKYATEDQDLLPAEQPYNLLKRANQLTMLSPTTTELGDCKPSQFLRPLNFYAMHHYAQTIYYTSGRSTIKFRVLSIKMLAGRWM